MSDKIVPGHYSVSSLLIESYDGSRSNEIKNIFHSLEFIEAMDEGAIHGSIKIADTINLLDDFPLRAEERVTLTMTDAIDQEIMIEFEVYSIDNIILSDNGDGMIYDLAIVSAPRAKSEATRINWSYRGRISDMVKDIFDEFYDTDKEIEIEETSGEYRLVIPNLNPEGAIEFLSRRAYAETSATQSFAFFETKERYYFATYEFIRAHEESIPDDVFKRLKFLYYEPNIDLTGQGLLKMMENVIEIDIPNRVATIGSNPYKRRTVELDIIQRSTANNEFDYSDNILDYSSSMGMKSSVKNTNEYISDRFEDNQDELFVIKDYSEDDSTQEGIRSNTYYPNIINNKIAFLTHMSQCEIGIKTYGRNDLMPGNMVDLRIPEFKYQPGEEREQNKTLAGRYMIISVKSRLIEDEFTQQLKIQKIDWNPRTNNP